MNRVVITLDANGEIDSICADEPVEIYWNQPSRPHDRVYLYGSAEFGPVHVRKAIGGYAVGHAHDGTLGAGDGTGKRPPSKPTLRAVDVPVHVAQPGTFHRSDDNVTFTDPGADG